MARALLESIGVKITGEESIHFNVFNALNLMLIGRKLGLSHKKCNLFDASNCHITLARFRGTKLDYIHYVNSKELV
jgi:hypothetical protein